MTAAADLTSSYELVVIGGGPAGLAAAALAARAGVSTVLFDENPGVGGQIYRAIISTPVSARIAPESASDSAPRGVRKGSPETVQSSA